MAFIRADFRPVGGIPGSTNTATSGQGQGMAEYSYATTDAFSVVEAAGYFNELRDELTPQNTIHVSANTGDLDPDGREFGILMTEVVPQSPLTTDVTMDSKTIEAA